MRKLWNQSVGWLLKTGACGALAWLGLVMPAAAQSEIQFAVTNLSVFESNSLAIVLTCQPAANASVNYSITPIDPGAMNKVASLANGTITFGGSPIAFLNLNTLYNTNIEGTLSVRVTLSNPNNGVLGTQSSAVVRILDRDALFRFSTDIYRTSEDSNAVEVIVIREGNTNGPASVDFRTIDGSTTETDDYLGHPIGVTIFFSDGQISNIVSIPLVDDCLMESNRIGTNIFTPTRAEVFTNELYNPIIGFGNTLIIQSNSIVQIDDNDSASGHVGFYYPLVYPVITGESSENTNVPLTTIRVRVDRPCGSGGISVDYRVSGGSSCPGTTNAFYNINNPDDIFNDFHLATPNAATGPNSLVGTLTWGQNDNDPKTFDIIIRRDFWVELDETINIQLENERGVGGTPAPSIQSFARDYAITILFDDQPSGAVLRSYNLPSMFVQDPGANNNVYAVALHEGGAILGGDFTAVNTVPRNGVARIFAGGQLDESWNPGEAANGSVFAIGTYLDSSTHAGKVIVAGSFTAFNGQPRNGIARLNRNGTLDATFAPGNAAQMADGVTPAVIRAVTVLDDNKIIIAGDFDTYNSVPRRNLARLNEDGSLDVNFDPGSGANGTVWALALQPPPPFTINLSGFSSNEFRTNLNATAAVGSFTLDYNVFVIPSTNAPTNGYSGLFKVFYEGQQLFDSGTNTSGQATLDFGLGASTLLQVVVNEGTTNAPVGFWSAAFTISPRGSASKVLAGGDFTTMGGAPRSRIARLNNNGTVDNTFATDTGPDNTVYALLVQPNNRIILGGNFTTLGVISRKGVGRLMVDGALDVTFNPGAGANGPVYTMAFDTNGAPFIAGEFTLFNDTGRTNIARLYPDGTLDTSFLDNYYNQTLPGFNQDTPLPGVQIPGNIRSIAVRPDASVLAGGRFDRVGGGTTAYEVRIQHNYTVLVGGPNNSPDLRNLPGNVQFVKDLFTVDENVSSGRVMIDIERINGVLGSIAIFMYTEDGSAVAGRDYEYFESGYIWPSCGGGGLGSQIGIPILDNQSREGNRDFNLVLVAPFGTGIYATNSPSLGFRSVAKVTIVDNDFDNGALGFTVPYYYVAEDGTNAVITVTRTNGSNGSVSVQYLTLDGSALRNSDYTLASGTITFAAGVTNMTFKVPIINDVAVESEETIQLFLFNPQGGATLGRATATLVVTDNDNGRGSISFSANDYPVIEGIGAAPIVIRRTGGAVSTQEVTVVVREITGLTNGAAIAGADFTPSTNILRFAQGETAKTILVPITPDTLVEGAEYFEVAISTNAGAYGQLGVVINSTVSILDDDSYGTLAFLQPRFAVNEMESQAVLTVVRRAGNSGRVTVEYQTEPVVSPDAALEGVNYLGATGTLVWEDGDTTAKTFTVPILYNPALEGNRLLGLRLSNPAKATLGDNPVATLMIVDLESQNVPAGSVDTAFNASPGIDNFVRTIVVQNDGRLLVGGDFSSVNGVSRNRIARLHLNGALDTTFDPLQGFNDTVHALALQTDGKVIAAGRFTRFDVTNRFGIARLNTDGRMDNLFNPGSGANNPIFALAAHPDGRIAVGGMFNTFNGIERPNLAVLATNGSVLISFAPGTGPNGTVYALAYQPDGKLIVGGDFTKYGGNSRNNIARVNPNGSLDLSFDPGLGPDDSVRTLVVQEDGRIVIGGLFTSVNNLERGHIARLNTDGSLDESFLATGAGADGAVFGLSVQTDGKVVAVGDFNRFNGVSRNCITRLYQDGATDLTINIGTGANGHIAAVVNQSDDQIVIGGGFTVFNGVERSYFARLIGYKNPGSGRLEFLTPVFNHQENLTNAIITVRRNWGTSNEVRVTYSTVAGGTAGANDYVPVTGELVFPAGETLQTFTVGIVNDAEVETPETVNLLLSNPTNVTLGAEAELDLQTTAQLVIHSDDNLVSFSSPTYVVNENVVSGFAVITVLRSGATNGFASVDIEAVGVTAFAGMDFQNQPTTLTFAPGETVKYYYLSIADDTQVEGDETAQIILSNPSGNTVLGQSAALLTIRDNDFAAGTLNFEFANYLINEFETNLVIRVVRSGGSSGVVTVDYTTADGSAQTGLDYLSRSSSLTFAEAETVKTFSVPILQDFLTETNETVLLRLANARGAAGAAIGNLGQATLTILDSPLLNGNFAFSATNYTASETSGVVAITVLRRYGAVGPVSVNYAVTAGTAQPDVNFMPTNGTLVWAGGDAAPKTFLVTVISNSLVEGNLTVNLALSAPAGGATLGSPATATLSLADSSVGPGLLLFSSPVYTFAENSTNAIITVIRTNGSLGAASVDYATADGTGVAGHAYVATTGTLVFSNGQTSATFAVPLIERAGADLNKTVNLSLANPTNAVLGSLTSAVLTITESQTVAGLVNATFAPMLDGAVDVVFVQTNGENKIYIAGSFTMVDFNIRTNMARLNPNGTLDQVYNVGTGPSNGMVRAIAALEDSRAYVGGSFIGFGEATNSYLVRLLADGTVDTAFVARPDNAVNAIAALSDGRLLIGGLFTSVGGVQRGYLARLQTSGALDFTFLNGEGADGAVRVIAVQADGRILIGGDFNYINGIYRPKIARLLANGNVDTSFNPGTGPDDSVRALSLQPDNSILIGGLFNSVAGVSRGRIARLLPSGALDLTFNPGGGADEFVSTLALQNDGKVLVGGGFTTFNGYRRNRLTRLNTDGAVDTTFNVGTGANNFVNVVTLQADQRILVAGGFTTFNGLPQPYLVRLNNGFNLGPGAFEYAVANFTVNENGSNAVVTVVRSIGTAGEVRVDYATSNGTALNGTHYTAVSGTLVFPDGETVQSFTVPIIDNNTATGDRTIRLALSNPQGGAELGAGAQAFLTIVENDGIIGFSQVNYSANEGAGFATIEMVRSAGSIGEASVDYSVSDGTAIAASDYQPVFGTAYFFDGQTRATIFIPLIEDALIEGDETVNLYLSNPVNASLGASNATLTIVDNDFGPGVLGFSVATYTVAENAVSVNITVRRTGGSLGGVSVNYIAAAGSATAGADFNTTNGTLQFADGEISKTFTVQVLNDGLSEGNETVLLSLANPQGGATLDFLASTAILNIADDDVTPGAFRFLTTNFLASENEFYAIITVVRTNGTTGSARVDFVASPGSASPNIDFYGVTNTLVFADGEVSQDVFITLVDDVEVEPTETVQLRLLNPRDGTTLTAPSTATLSILDNESVINMSASAYTVNEDAGSARINVIRSGGTGTVVSINFAATGGSALPGSDFTPVSGQLVFQIGETVKNFDVAITDNAITNVNKTVNLSLFAPLGGALVGAVSNAVLTIVDNDSYLAFAASAYTVSESDGAVVVTVRRTGSIGTPASVNFTVGGGTAVGGTHYYPTNITLFFSSNESQKTVSVPVIPNNVKDGNRTVNLTLSFPSRGATIIQGSAVVTILDDDDSIIIPVAKALVSEAGASANGIIDPNETVTVNFALRNVGNLTASNVVATLLATNGVVTPSGAQNYGTLAANGVSVSRSFTFTAGTTNGGVVRAVLQLQDGATSLGTVTFNLQVGPLVTRFANTNTIAILDDGAASPYPSAITVGGLNGAISKVTVTVSNITHAFPRDIGMMLVGPRGQRLVLMSYAVGGWDYALNNVTLTFDDAATNAIPANGGVTSGRYRPANYFSLAYPPPAPSLPPSTNQLNVFNGTDANGVWTLYVMDQASPDVGQILNGWSLNISTVESFPAAADVAVSATASSASLAATSNLTYNIFVQNGGPSSAGNVTVTNLLPAGVTLLSVNTSVGSVATNANRAVFSLGTLASGASANLSLLVNCPNPGVLTNIVMAVSSVNDPAAANNTAAVLVGVTSATPPSFSGVVATNGGLQLTVSGALGSIYYVDVSTNLTQWLRVSTNVLTGPSSTFTVPTSLSDRAFFRIMLP